MSMAFFDYKVVTKRLGPERSAIACVVAIPTSNSPECTKKLEGKVVALLPDSLFSKSVPNPAIKFVAPLGVDGIEAVCKVVRKYFQRR